ncbi:CPCC family cysteine-rich protein [Cnuibacter physcomitrellae]|uniref:CPCC family cysteine-rich protein n=1 Tax=Cnuibacter physcomitrellae TaxID=1619308 RepID=UPI002175C697|nr:CPCC family cysteine-rich protein [Cnuibacter physcomitrellae]MCS5497122.1 CPCC family cysteine-rich protein [Cnuibacter physcomitrellae]
MHPCPCCGFRTLDEPPGSYEICPVCWWEDDAVQLRYPEFRGGANHPSLLEAQATFLQQGTSDPRLRQHTRPPSDAEAAEPGWRPVDSARDAYEREVGLDPWPDDLTRLYWWRPTYWRVGHERPR